MASDEWRKQLNPDSAVKPPNSRGQCGVLPSIGSKRSSRSTAPLRSNRLSQLSSPADAGEDEEGG